MLPARRAAPPCRGARALQALIAKAGETHPGLVARVYAERGETDRAFEWLERAYALESTHTVPVLGYHDLRAIKLEPLYRKLHGDPRFAALVKKLNLPVD